MIHTKPVKRRTFYIEPLGTFFQLRLTGDGSGQYEVYSQPANGHIDIPSTDDEWTKVGYMGNEVGYFDTLREAEGFLRGVKFEGELL